MAKRRVLLGLSLLLCGCGDVRFQSLAEAARQTHDLVLSAPLVKLAGTLKGSAAEQRRNALYSLEGHKLWPAHEKSEFSFLAPSPGVWPSRILLLDRPDTPWSVVVRGKGPQQLEISAYAMDMDKPQSTELVDIQ